MAADNASFAVSGDSHVALKAAKASLFNRTTSASSIARLAFSRIACTTKSLKVFEPTKAEARAARFLMSGSNRRSSLATLCCIFSSAGNFSFKEFSSASPRYCVRQYFSLSPVPLKDTHELYGNLPYSARSHLLFE
tara:strand:- start:2542 stop:2949 length:408 start_codon:yes stop_codon:yes gene_type:complete